MINLGSPSLPTPIADGGSDRISVEHYTYKSQITHQELQYWTCPVTFQVVASPFLPFDFLNFYGFLDFLV